MHTTTNTNATAAPTLAHRLRTAALVAIALTGVATCGSSSHTTSSSSTKGAPSSTSGLPTQPASSANIVIKTFQFTPSPASATAGAITVRNDDDTTHTFTSDDGKFNLTLKGPNASGTVTLQPGTYRFHSAIHTSMTGEIVVK